MNVSASLLGLLALVEPAAADFPASITFRRPETLWRKGGVPVSQVVASDGKQTVFVVREDVGAIAALDAGTGAMRWQTHLSQDTRRRPQDLTRLQVEGNRLLYSDTKHLAAFSLPDGRRLWERPGENCRFFGSTDDHALVRCPGPEDQRRQQLILHRDGSTARTFPLARGDTSALGPSLVVTHASNGHLKRHALGTGAGWSVPIGPSHDRGDEIHVVQPADRGPPIILAAGRTTRAFDSGSGKLLWEHPETTPGRDGLQVRLAVDGDHVVLLGADAIVARDVRSGRQDARWPLTGPLGPQRRVGLLLAAGGRIVLLAAAATGSPAMIFTARKDTPLSPLDSPVMRTSDWELLAGDRLVYVSTLSAAVRAFDLTRTRPPLATLPPRQAVEAAEADMKGEEGLCERWAMLTHARSHFQEMAARYPNPHWSCAMSLLGSQPEGRGPLLRRQAGEAKSHDDRMEILRQLRADDDPATSAMMAGIARNPTVTGPNPEMRRSELVGVAYDHLWRTGRAGQVGLCKAGARTDPRLRPGKPGAGIGTAHPVFIEAIAGNGSWAHVCQARKDSDGDGKVAMTYESTWHSSHWKGDDLQPYLVVGSGPGREVEEVLAHDPTGRYLATREGPCLTVIDTSTATVTTLPDADLRGDVGQPPRRIAFDAAGRSLLYVRGGRHMRLVVRDLATGRERELEPGPGHPVSARLTPDGRWVVLEVGRPWSNDASGTWVSSRCESTMTRGHLMEEDTPPQTTRRLIPVAGGPAIDPRSDVVTPFGDGLLVRDDAGALLVQDPAGKRQALVPADCKGTLVHADPPRTSVVVVCAPLAPLPDEMVLYYPGGQRRLGRQEAAQVDRWSQPPDRQVDIEGRHVDMSEARPIAPPSPGKLTAWVPDEGNRRGGIYAHRSDGKRLMPETTCTWRSGSPAPRGPLTWR